MSHKFTVSYDREIIIYALNRFFYNRLGFKVAIPMALFFIIYFSISVSGPLNHIMQVSLIVILVLIGMIIYSYLLRRKQGESFLAYSESTTVEFELDEEGIKTKSDLGTLDLKWTMFDEVLKFKKAWLLVFQKNTYLTFPIESLSEDMKTLMEESLKKKKNSD